MTRQAPRPVLARLPVRDRKECRSWTNSYQIDGREQPHPDDVERVPEQGETQQPPLHAGAKTPDLDLRHHYDQPDQAGGDMQSVAADKREECGKESATLRRRSARDHVGELADLKIKECRTEHESDRSKDVGLVASSR